MTTTKERDAPAAAIVPALLTTEQACEYLGGITPPTLYDWARRHRIQKVKISRTRNGHVRWRRADLDRLINLSAVQMR